jgi:hypothetical protein
VEGIGIVILCVWVAVPVREFTAIWRHLAGGPDVAAPGSVGRGEERGEQAR